MDKEQRYRMEAHHALSAAVSELGQAQWRLSFIGDYVNKARIESLIILVTLLTDHLYPTSDQD